MTGPIDPEILRYYAESPEEERLTRGAHRLERARTERILMRVLPKAPATVMDVGGAAGAYAFWLAESGYELHLLDASRRLVDLARTRNQAAAHPLATCEVGDARELPYGEGSADALLLLGPLYHLPERSDRVRALAEARRVLKPGGVCVAAVISRYASALDGMSRDLLADRAFWKIVETDLVSGRHHNPTDRLDYFTTAYFHAPEELSSEVVEAGFDVESLIGVEGPAWLLPDIDARLDNETGRERLMWVLERTESEPGLLGASAHILAVARKRAGTAA